MEKPVGYGALARATDTPGLVGGARFSTFGLGLWALEVLDLLTDTRRFAGTVPQVVQLGATYVAAAFHLNLSNCRAV